MREKESVQDVPLRRNDLHKAWMYVVGEGIECDSG